MNRRGRPKSADVLTPREQEVLTLIQEGFSNREIAEKLGISLAGAKFHVAEIISRLGVADRQEAAQWRRPRQAILAPFFAWLQGLRRSHGYAAMAGAISLPAVAVLAVTLLFDGSGSQGAAGMVAASPTVARFVNSPQEIPAFRGGRVVEVHPDYIVVEEPSGRYGIRVDGRTEVTRPTGHALVTDSNVSRLRPGDTAWAEIRPGSALAIRIEVNAIKVVEVLIEHAGGSELLGHVNDGIPGSSTPLWAAEMVRVVDIQGAIDIGGSRQLSSYQAGERVMFGAYIADDGTLIPSTRGP